MSMKTRILLQRAGRDQFGDPGDATEHYRSSRLSRREKDKYHTEVRSFFEAYWSAWHHFCEGKSSREVWAAMFLHSKPAFSTFEKQRRAFVSLPEFLKYTLVLYRWYALAAMGHSHDASRTILDRYEALGRYCIEPQIGERKPGRSVGYVARIE